MDWVDDKGRTWTTLDQPVAGGGQSKVYRTLDGRHGVKVAAAGEDARLEGEARALADLVAAHPDLSEALVVPVAAGSRPRAFLVMEWWPWDAERWLDQRTRTLLERLRLAEACCQAVVALHWADGERDRNMLWRFEDGVERKGRVVHRDVKPANFLLREEDGRLHVRLGDFGAVRMPRAGVVATVTRIYTPGYAPVEQTLGRPVVPTVDWDVYAMGVTVFQLLEGSQPVGCAAAQYELTDLGRRLCSLNDQLAGRSNLPSLKKERDALACKPLAELVDYGKLCPFDQYDQDALEKRLGTCPGLVRALRRALSGRPQHRMTDARELLSPLVDLREREEEKEKAVAQQTSKDMAPRPPPTDTVRPIRVAAPIAAAEGAGTVAPRRVPDQACIPVPLVAQGPPLPPARAVGEPIEEPALVMDRRARRSPVAPLIPMVCIPAGELWIGATTGQQGLSEENERPAVKIRIPRNFWMGVTPVTHAQWEAVDGCNPSEFKYRLDRPPDTADLPVERVTWFDAVQFANALSLREGLPECYLIQNGDVQLVGLSCPGYRLPTEAEWEYAARAGWDTLYAGGDDNDAVAWLDCGGPQPVAGKRANAWGLCDMSGNVWEWCWDWHGPYAGGVDPLGPPDGPGRVLRGGAWNSLARDARLAFRGWGEPDSRHSFVGLRLVRSVQTELLH